MFDTLVPADLLAAVGRVLRATAQIDGPIDDFARSQLLSAYSICRFLVPEIAAAEDLAGSLHDQLLDVMSESDDAVVAGIRSRLERNGSTAAGEAAAEAMERCREVPALTSLGESLRCVLASVVEQHAVVLGGAPR